MNDVLFRLIIAVLSPFISLSEKVQDFQKKRKVKNFVLDALSVEVEEYRASFNELLDFGNKFVLLIRETGEPPTSIQLIEFLKFYSQFPKKLGKSIISFIKLAKACKELSAQQALMEYLKKSDIMLYDFVLRMADAYVEENTLKINGRFLRFFSAYKKEILRIKIIKKIKKLRLSEANKKEIELIVNRAKIIARSFNAEFFARFMRHPAVRKLNKNLKKLSDISQSVILEYPPKPDLLDVFIPNDLRPITAFLKDFQR